MRRNKNQAASATVQQDDASAAMQQDTDRIHDGECSEH